MDSSFMSDASTAASSPEKTKYGFALTPKLEGRLGATPIMIPTPSECYDSQLNRLAECKKDQLDGEKNAMVDEYLADKNPKDILNKSGISQDRISGMSASEINERVRDIEKFKIHPKEARRRFADKAWNEVESIRKVQKNRRVNRLKKVWDEKANANSETSRQNAITAKNTMKARIAAKRPKRMKKSASAPTVAQALEHQKTKVSRDVIHAKAHSLGLDPKDRAANMTDVLRKLCNEKWDELNAASDDWHADFNEKQEVIMKEKRDAMIARITSEGRNYKKWQKEMHAEVAEGPLVLDYESPLDLLVCSAREGDQGAVEAGLAEAIASEEKKGSGINGSGRSGNTLLTAATLGANLPLVQFLCDSGATNANDRKGYTPLGIAEQHLDHEGPDTEPWQGIAISIAHAAGIGAQFLNRQKIRRNACARKFGTAKATREYSTWVADMTKRVAEGGGGFALPGQTAAQLREMKLERQNKLDLDKAEKAAAVKQEAKNYKQWLKEVNDRLKSRAKGSYTRGRSV